MSFEGFLVGHLLSIPQNLFVHLINIVKKIFFTVYAANKNIKNWNECIIFCYKKNLEISFQNGPEHETTSLNRFLYNYF